MYGNVATIERAMESAIGHWERAIKHIQPLFRFERRRGADGRYKTVKIYGDPVGSQVPGSSVPVSVFPNINEAYERMEQLAIYYQVGSPTEKQLSPPPRWFAPEAKAFWERASRRDIRKGNYVERFGDKLVINYVDAAGVKQVVETAQQLIWVLAGADKRIHLESFHYLDTSSIENPVQRDAFDDWNRSMYAYIERQKLRPEVAKQKLAGVNHELHKALMKAFFGMGAAGGVVNISGGYGPVIEMAIDFAHKDVYEWYQRFLSEK